MPSGLSSVKAIYSTRWAFAALKEDGTVEAWGDSSSGGSSVPSTLSGVVNIYGMSFFLSQSIYPHTYHFEDNSVPVPTSQPSTQPSSRPSSQPSSQPSTPTGQPSGQPTSQPSTPTGQPSGQPSSQPSSQPSTNSACMPTSELSTIEPTSKSTSGVASSQGNGLEMTLGATVALVVTTTWICGYIYMAYKNSTFFSTKVHPDPQYDSFIPSP